MSPRLAEGMALRLADFGGYRRPLYFKFKRMMTEFFTHKYANKRRIDQDVRHKGTNLPRKLKAP